MVTNAELFNCSEIPSGGFQHAWLMVQSIPTLRASEYEWRANLEPHVLRVIEVLTLLLHSSIRLKNEMGLFQYHCSLCTHIGWF